MNKAVINNIQVFKDIYENLQGCMRTTGKEFDCEGCNHLGTCFKVVQESVAAVAMWIADQIEANSELVKKIGLDTILEPEESIKKNSSLYS